MRKIKYRYQMTSTKRIILTPSFLEALFAWLKDRRKYPDASLYCWKVKEENYEQSKIR